jgi:hypothetical protein
MCFGISVDERTQLLFTADHCEKLVKVLNACQSNDTNIHSSYNILNELDIQLIASASHAKEHCREGPLAAHRKLQEYFGAKQPGIDLLKSVRLLDPSQISLFDGNFSIVTETLKITDCSKAKWQPYQSTAGETYDINPLQFWRRNSSRLPCLSKKAVSLLQ